METPTPRRPLSPHATVWRFHFTMISSIFHRITGVATVGGVIMITAWLVALALGKDAYATYVSYAASPLGVVAWFLVSFAFFVHFAGGIRHMLWDVGLLLQIKKAETLTIWTQVMAAAMTIIFWSIMLASGKISF